MTMLPKYGTTGMKPTNRIGIFGGTFDPVHIGHRQTALFFRDKFALDLLYIIPNFIPPLKNRGGVSGEDRLNMLKIAFSGCENIKISDTELKRKGTSYTCDTVAEIKEKHKGSELFLLTGDDWIGQFEKWKNYRYILENVTLVVADRSGRDISDDIEHLYEISGRKPLLLGNGVIELSSTELRNNIKKELLPENVYQYIVERGLYGL